MPKLRFQRLSEARQREILDVAARHFAKDGFEGASYNRIMEEAGLSKGSAYYTFVDKADLYSTVLCRAAELLFAQPVALSSESVDCFWGSMRQWLVATLEALAREPLSAELFIGYFTARRVGRAPSLDGALEAQSQEFFISFLEVGQRIGAVRADLEQALLLSLLGAVFSTLDSYYLARLSSMKPAELIVTLDLYIDTIRRLLAPGAARS